MSIKGAQDLRLGGGAGALNIFIVQAHHLLLLADDARLPECWRTMRDGHEFDARISRASLQQYGGFVSAGQRDERRMSAQRDDVRRGVRRSAEDPYAVC